MLNVLLSRRKKITQYFELGVGFKTDFGSFHSSIHKNGSVTNAWNKEGIPYQTTETTPLHLRRRTWSYWQEQRRKAPSVERRRPTLDCMLGDPFWETSKTVRKPRAAFARSLLQNFGDDIVSYIFLGGLFLVGLFLVSLDSFCLGEFFFLNVSVNNFFSLFHSWQFLIWFFKVFF